MPERLPQYLQKSIEISKQPSNLSQLIVEEAAARKIKIEPDELKITKGTLKNGSTYFEIALPGAQEQSKTNKRIRLVQPKNGDPYYQTPKETKTNKGKRHVVWTKSVDPLVYLVDSLTERQKLDKQPYKAKVMFQ